MKFFAVLLFLFLSSCQLELENEKNTGVDTDGIQKASDADCLVGTSYKRLASPILFGQDPTPDPILFAISRGGFHCALEHDISEASTGSWLEVKIPNNCLENGSLWTLQRQEILNTNHFYLDLKRVNSVELINLHTEVGHSSAKINQSMGLQIYTCQ